MATAAPPPPVDSPAWASTWSPARLESQRHALYLARLEHLRRVMRQTGMPALLVMDANHIFYATGARNMQIFALRSPSRYLLVFESGPCILYEYAGCAHLAADLPTVTHTRTAIGTGFLGSGGAVAQASTRFAADIADTLRAVDPAIDNIGIDRFPLAAVDALRRQGFHLRDADEALVRARAVKLPNLSRTFLCGDGAPAPVQRQLYQLAQEQVAWNAALLRPGLAYRELAERAWPCPDEYRPYRYGLIGHGLGLAGEFPNIPHYEPGEPYPLDGQIEPGMVICVESYVGSPAAGQGVKLENQYLVHDDHVENLSTYPMDARLGGT